MEKKINAQMKKIILNNKSQPIISNIEQKSNQGEEFQPDIIKRKVYRRSPSLNPISKKQLYLSMKKYSIHFEVKSPLNKRVVKITLNGSEEFQSQPIGRSKNHQITSKNFNGVLFNNGDSLTLYQNETDINKNQIVGI